MRRQLQPLLSGVVLGGILLLGPSSPAMAAGKTVCPICDKTGEWNGSYPVKAGSTLVRGTANLLLGWTELIRQPTTEVKHSGNVLLGLGKGVGQGITRTLGGAVEVLTFWVPNLYNRSFHVAHDCPLCMGDTRSSH